LDLFSRERKVHELPNDDSLVVDRVRSVSLFSLFSLKGIDQPQVNLVDPSDFRAWNDFSSDINDRDVPPSAARRTKKR
jgi:hypothetical protein